MNLMIFSFIFFHLLRIVNPLYEEVFKIRTDYRETGNCKCNCDFDKPS